MPRLLVRELLGLPFQREAVGSKRRTRCSSYKIVSDGDLGTAAERSDDMAE
jgi:hypothetical protein